MAESKGGGVFAKTFTKQFIRTKAKVLQNLGKADKTTDQEFDEYVINVTRQQTAAQKLQKELKNYTTCLKALAGASHNMFEAIAEIYEPQWVEYQTVKQSTESLDLLWGDYQQKLYEQFSVPLNTYLNHFHDVRQKIKKRERKLVDFDNSRHNYDSLANAKKRDDAKINKAHEDLTERKGIYDHLHAELNTELPDLFDSRITFYINSFQALYTAETIFHEESSKLNNALSESVDVLSRENVQGKYNVKRSEINAHNQSTPPHATNGDRDLTSSNKFNIPKEEDRDRRPSGLSSISESSDKALPSGNATNHTVHHEDTYEAVDVGSQGKDTSPRSAEDVDDDDEYTYIEPETATKQSQGDTSIYTVPADDPAVYQVPESNQAVSDDFPLGVLYQVKASHDYSGADDDELTFTAGDVINVIPFDDPEDQDEGWLMGTRVDSTRKGVFPANFTKPI